MTGNAVPVNLAKFIASGIIMYLAEEKVGQTQLFDWEEEFKLANKALHRMQ